MDIVQYTVLIADSSQDFCKELKNILRWSCTVHTCCKGRSMLKLLEEFRPDVLVVDLMLPELNGNLLLRMTDLLGYRPIMIATTNLVSKDVLSFAQIVGVDYLIMKPCYTNAVAARIEAELYRKNPSHDIWEPLRSRISESLLMLGFSAKLHGFRYLQEALLYMVRTPNQSITKELYVSVAEACQCTEGQVERSVRSAIQGAWKNRQPQLWSVYFHPDGREQEGCPSNAAFITRIADSLRDFWMEREVTEDLEEPQEDSAEEKIGPSIPV